MALATCIAYDYPWELNEQVSQVYEPFMLKSKSNTK